MLRYQSVGCTLRKSLALTGRFKFIVVYISGNSFENYFKDAIGGKSVSVKFGFKGRKSLLNEPKVENVERINANVAISCGFPGYYRRVKFRQFIDGGS